MGGNFQLRKMLNTSWRISLNCKGVALPCFFVLVFIIMPYEVKKVKNKYKLFNLHKKKYVNVNYSSKQKAINSAKVFMKYRNEKPIVRGNYVLKKN